MARHSITVLASAPLSSSFRSCVSHTLLQELCRLNRETSFLNACNSSRSFVRDTSPRRYVSTLETSEPAPGRPLRDRPLDPERALNLLEKLRSLQTLLEEMRSQHWRPQNPPVVGPEVLLLADQVGDVDVCAEIRLRRPRLYGFRLERRAQHLARVPRLPAPQLQPLGATRHRTSAPVL